MSRARVIGVGAIAFIVVTALYAIAARQQKQEVGVQREVVLKTQLETMRKAIADYRRDNGQYPKSLNELVPKYLRAIPEDPFTGSTTSWRVTTEDLVRPNSDFMKTGTEETESYVVDVHSGAGQPYANF